ncbi:hypothetical protein PGT21_023511 [Puccinia graminis f. sp. tritici]|uniref:Uncharacterized protein n=1 Tax=Puccinia graminis f. sp. tritici TaxID=56615 RepID=A0A5B0P6J7_PUCGR|nr:hypothetical protein PGT21_023511 [Puccinia graminis f. sp. tritici]KAA1131799.1 hypothetical protein PGTUg99_026181 [Puccinia graminis f. sp. tritici]
MLTNRHQINTASRTMYRWANRACSETRVQVADVIGSPEPPGGLPRAAHSTKQRLRSSPCRTSSPSIRCKIITTATKGLHTRIGASEHFGNQSDLKQALVSDPLEFTTQLVRFIQHQTAPPERASNPVY